MRGRTHADIHEVCKRLDAGLIWMGASDYGPMVLPNG